MAQSPDHRGKRTAEVVALARAAGHRDPAIANPDFLAERLLNFKSRLLLSPPLRGLVRASFERRVPGMFLYHQARTKYLDQLLLNSLGGLRQLIILGAGLDTRAYRFAERLEQLRVFEVDHPGTAAWKRERLHRLGRPTSHVNYIAMDFTRENLAQRLAQAGYERGAPSFFLWEGVVMYLPREAVESTLAVLAQAAPGSCVAFDYVYRASLERPADFLGAVGYHRYVERRGEPCRFGLDAEEVAPLLRRYGYELVSNAGPVELRQLVPAGPICDYFGIAQGRLTTTA